MKYYRTGKRTRISDLEEEIKNMSKKIYDLIELEMKSVGTNFVEEESVIDVGFVNETSGMNMIVDSRGGVDKNEMEYEDCFKRFRFGENVYESKTRI